MKRHNLMAFYHPVIGIDIGHYTIKMCQVIRGKRGIGRVRIRVGSRTNGESWGNLQQDISKIFREGNFRGHHVAICLSQEAVEFKYIVLPAASCEEMEAMVEWAAKEHFPFLYENGYFAYHPCGDKVLIAATQAPIYEWKATMNEVGLNLAAVEAPCFAWLRVWDYAVLQHNANLYRLVVDIGWERTGVLLAHGGNPLLFKSMNLGGESLTRGLMDAYGLSWEEAEIKKCRGHFLCDEKIFTLWMNHLVEGLKNFIKEGKTYYPDIESGVILLLGGGANLIGLPEALEVAFKTPVEKPAVFRKDYLWDTENEKDENDTILPLISASLGIALREVEEDEN